jgi:Arc/MetJ-type ribon-helix-helix transcriptional regulator
MIMSKPVQVYLDDHEMERLEAWVKKRGWTKSQAVRAAVRALTRSRDEDPLLKACGMIEGLPEDLSRRIDDYLEETFVAEKPVSTYRRRRRSR